MRPDQFKTWLFDMVASGRAKTEAEAGRIIGLTSKNTVSKFKRFGSDRRTAMACAAAINDLLPYPGREPPITPVEREAYRAAFVDAAMKVAPSIMENNPVFKYMKKEEN